MPDYGLKIKIQGINKDVEDCLAKECVFWSKYACAKILQTDRQDITVSNGSSPTYTIPFESDIAFPALIMVFLYDPSDSSYIPLGGSQDVTYDLFRGNYSFDSDELFVQVENYTGAGISTHFIYFICYA